MSRHQSTETFHLDLRSPNSQQLPEASRSSSIDSQQEESAEQAGGQTMNARHSGQRSHRLDLYSIPVFLLELILLAALAYSAYYVHFQLKYEPLVSGFYCDDVAYRQQFVATDLTKFLSGRNNEPIAIILALSIPVILIVFCELVNSMFGALKFRQIRALCACCKLHSITRRTIRFTGAFLLGFLFVCLTCDILATSTGRLRPFFAQECPSAYSKCNLQQARSLPFVPDPPQSVPSNTPPVDTANIKPASQPISQPASISVEPTPSNRQVMRLKRQLSASTQAGVHFVAERQWIDLTGQSLADICRLPAESADEAHRLEQLAKSWPAFPAAVFTYACLFLAFYLSYVGTARPFRMFTSILVVVVLMLATIFNVYLVRDHFYNWEDVLAGAVLALVVVVFVLSVYLNRFRDTHYYENQKIIKTGARASLSPGRTTFSGVDGPYNMDKTAETPVTNGALQNGEVRGSFPNNDLAMRYFQIPRANYRSQL